MNRAYTRFFQVGESLFEIAASLRLIGLGTSPFQVGSETKLELSCCLLSESNRDNLVDGSSAAGQHCNDPLHQLAGLARSGSSLNDHVAVEVLPNLVSRVLVDQGHTARSLTAL